MVNRGTRSGSKSDDLGKSFLQINSTNFYKIIVC